MKASLIILFTLLSSQVLAIRNGVNVDNKYIAELSIKTRSSNNRGSAFGLSSNSTNTCSGIRIHRNYILTVSHCFKDLRSNGSFTVYYWDKNQQGQDVRFYASVSHRNVIKNSLMLSEELALIPIYPTTDSFIEPDIYFGDLTPSKLTFYGYGMNENGKLGTLRSGELKQSYTKLVDENYMLVTTPGPKNEHPCPGDSGGPLFKEKDGKDKLFGLVSYINNPNVSLIDEDGKFQCNNANQSHFIILQNHVSFLKTYMDLGLAEATNLAEKSTSGELIFAPTPVEEEIEIED